MPKVVTRDDYHGHGPNKRSKKRLSSPLALSSSALNSKPVGERSDPTTKQAKAQPKRLNYFKDSGFRAAYFPNQFVKNGALRPCTMIDTRMTAPTMP